MDIKDPTMTAESAESSDLNMKESTASGGCEHCVHRSDRTKERSDKEFRSLMNRLKRIEGQIRGVEGMLEKDAYCPDILIQVSAINSALNSFNKELLASHIKSCVTTDIQNGNEDAADELVKVIQKLMK